MAKKNKPWKSAQQSAQVFQGKSMTGGTAGLNGGLCHITSPVFKIPGGPVIWGGRQTGIESRLAANGAKAFDLLIGLGHADQRLMETPINGSLDVDTAIDYNRLKGIAMPPPTLVIEWVDYSIPYTLGKPFWLALYDELKRLGEGKKVAIYCDGGHGRTGTALAILLAFAALDGLDWDGPRNTVAWLRENYCENVVESRSQIAYIGQVTGQDMSAIQPADAWRDPRQGGHTHAHAQHVHTAAPALSTAARGGKQASLPGWSQVGPADDDDDDPGYVSASDAATAAYLRGIVPDDH